MTTPHIADSDAFILPSTFEWYKVCRAQDVRKQYFSTIIAFLSDRDHLLAWSSNLIVSCDPLRG